MDNLLQMAVGKFGIGITGRNILTLLREAKTTIYATSRLGTDGTICRSTSTRSCTAAAMKDRECDFMFLSDLRNVFLPLIQRPVCHDVSTILIAVRVSDHDHLFIPTSREMFSINRQTKKILHDRRCSL